MKPQRLDLTYHFQWQSNWHVGSGYASAATDRLIRRLGGVHGMPFVPGSQVKGVLRHHCERLALALGFDAVDPHATSRQREEDLVRHFQPLADSKLLVDRLFGSRRQGDCLFVDNAIPSPNAERSRNGERVSTLRTRTAMDRVTGTVREGHLFTTEIAEGSSAVLEGRIRARHPSGALTSHDEDFPYEYALLLAALLCIDSLGGDKSVGLGRCQMSVKEASLKWNMRQLDVSEALGSFAEFGADWTEWVQTVRAERKAQ